MMDLGGIWQDFGLDRLEQGVEQLFPQWEISLEEMFSRIMSGDVWGALKGMFEDAASGFMGQLSGLRDVFIWLLVLGIVSSLMTHFVEIFDIHQVADMGFYFMYLLFIVVLLRCFSQAAQTVSGMLEDITLYIRLMVPAYMISVGVSTGAATVGAASQMMVLLIYGVEFILGQGVIPLIYSYVMLSVINGVWEEEKLSLLIDLLGKGIGWVLKGALGIVTGVSVVQALITPAVDSVRVSALQKLVSAIPGVGNAADGVVELIMGSALVIKNSIGVILLVLLLVLCAAPLFKVAAIAGIVKSAAAFMGIISDRRITACANRTGDAGLVLLRTAGTAVMLFLISIAMLTAVGKG